MEFLLLLLLLLIVGAICPPLAIVLLFLISLAGIVGIPLMFWYAYKSEKNKSNKQ